MRTLVHLSDLHFGRTDPQLIDPLLESIHAAAPHVVVVSGDLTQRARSHEFAAAKRFLDACPQPQIVVPGNHDVPLWNVFKRFVRPLRDFRKHITHDLSPSYVDDEIAVLGINTARSLVIKNGRVNAEQIARVQQEFGGLAESVTKIVVTHHPFDLPAHHHENDLVGRAELAMEAFARCGTDLLLAGHFHASHAGNTAERYGLPGHAALVVQAGTATSTRVRGESNSFNVLRIGHPMTSVERHEWQESTRQFDKVATERYEAVGGEWLRRSAPAG